jgi:hypothetical protein
MEGMSILWTEMLSPGTRHVQQDHDLPKQHIVQPDALPELLFSFKNDGDTDRHFIHSVKCNLLCNLQKAHVNTAGRAHS